ncbi:MAG: glycosyltransferase family 2 protein [Bacteroidaceae bacterium]
MSKISIIIPVHNTAIYLHKCVESVRNQSLKDIEIILVDNLSTDGSSELCDEYTLIDSRIKVLHLSVAGLSIARNAGINIATSQYIGFVDSDDYVEPNMYQDMLSALLENQAEMVYCNFCYEYEDQRTEYLYPNSGKTYVKSRKDALREILCDKISSSSCSKLFKKELFASILFPEGVFFEDHATVYKWMNLCQTIVWVDITYYHYLQREGSICHTLNPIKRYHFFLAEYPRLEFAKEQSLFEGDELFNVTTQIVRNCLYYFKQFMLIGKPKDHRELIENMRQKLRCWLLLPKSDLDDKYYKRLRKISYFWSIYYFTHYYFKKKN